MKKIGDNNFSTYTLKISNGFFGLGKQSDEIEKLKFHVENDFGPIIWPDIQTYRMKREFNSSGTCLQAFFERDNNAKINIGCIENKTNGLKKIPNYCFQNSINFVMVWDERMH